MNFIFRRECFEEELEVDFFIFVNFIKVEVWEVYDIKGFCGNFIYDFVCFSIR